MRVDHVFPYDPRQLGLDGPRAWADAQLGRWPLAAVAVSGHAARSTVHVLGPRAERWEAGGLEFRTHPVLLGGPRWWSWGDEWSASLGRTLALGGPHDVTVVHLNDYLAARLAHRAAARTRVVVVLHGRGTGPWDEHLAGAAAVVGLRRDALDELVVRGAPDGRLHLVTPSVDTAVFAPDGGERNAVVGFVGRVEASKGAFEVPGVVAELVGAGHDVHAELVGPVRPEEGARLASMAAEAGVGDRVRLVGPLPSCEVAERMRRWKVLLQPSHSEGNSLVVLEALASGLPVVAVEGVLPAEVAGRAGVRTGTRERLAEVVAVALEAPVLSGDPTVVSHAVGGRTWDELVDGLAPWSAGPVPARPWPPRIRRALPLRRVGRRLARRS